MVVNKDSATLGLSSERERQIGLDSDHSQMCKISHAGDDFLIINQALLWLFFKALDRSVSRKNLPKRNGSPEPGLLECLTKPSSSPLSQPSSPVIHPRNTKIVASLTSPRHSSRESDTPKTQKLKHRKSSTSSSPTDVKLHSSFGAWLESFRPNESPDGEATNKEKSETVAKADDAVNDLKTTSYSFTPAVDEAALPQSKNLTMNEPLTEAQKKMSSRTQCSPPHNKHTEKANQSTAGLPQPSTILGRSLAQQACVTKNATLTTIQRQALDLPKTTPPPQKQIA